MNYNNGHWSGWQRVWSSDTVWLGADQGRTDRTKVILILVLARMMMVVVVVVVVGDTYDDDNDWDDFHDDNDN